MRKMNLPNFIIIGAARSATSSLYFYLQQHPNVFMSPDKEAQFFGYHGTHRAHKSKYKSLEDYSHLFDGVTTEKIIGEATPTYLAIPEAASAIKQYCPDSKLLLSLRDPVERAYSYYEMSQSKGREAKMTFEQWIDGNDFWLANGGYAAHIQRYLELFSNEQLKVVLFEDIQARPADVIEDIHRYLEIEPRRPAEQPFVYNRGGSPRSAAASLIYKITTNRRLNSMLRPMVPATVVKMVHGLRSKSMERGTMNENTRQRLKEFFHDDVLRTQDLVGLNLEKWLQ